MKNKLHYKNYTYDISEDGTVTIEGLLLPMPEFMELNFGENIQTLDVKSAIVAFFVTRAPIRLEGVESSRNEEIFWHLHHLMDDVAISHNMPKRPKTVVEVVKKDDDKDGHLLPPNYSHYVNDTPKKKSNHARHMRKISHPFYG